MSDRSGDKKSKLEDETVKEHYTSHWDLDYLPKDEVDKLMQEPSKDDKPPARGHSGERQEDLDLGENPRRTAVLLLLGAVALFTIGILILRI